MWEKHDKNSDEYKSWKLSHKKICDINFDGSAGAMEPTGILELFQRSLNFNISGIKISYLMGIARHW